MPIIKHPIQDRTREVPKELLFGYVAQGWTVQDDAPKPAAKKAAPVKAAAPAKKAVAKKPAKKASAKKAAKKTS